jgi:hypothetical protein
MKTDPAWAEKFRPGSGLTEAELALAPLESTGPTPGVRQRGYARIPVRHRVAMELSASGTESTILLRDASLGGFIGTGDLRLPAGSRADVQIPFGSTPIKAVVLVRGARKGGISFEIVDIDFENRSSLRRFLIELQKQSS